jgi:hypothetical protein
MQLSMRVVDRIEASSAQISMVLNFVNLLFRSGQAKLVT